MLLLFNIILLSFVDFVFSQLLFEELKEPVMHPRTFYLTPHQEFQVISHVLCEGVPCPEFNVIQDHPYFIQQRSYRAAKFLRLTPPRLCSFKSVMEGGLQRLDNFTKGANDREEKYRKTLPLVIQVNQVTSKSKNPWCHMSFNVNFYTPHYWGTIATPKEFFTDFLDFEENLKMYVHTFDGDLEKGLLKEIEYFRRNLDSLRLCYKTMTFYVAIYDVPHSPKDSRLELWFLRCNGR